MTRTTFNEVAGVKEAKEELKEVVDFLLYPKKFLALGAKIGGAPAVDRQFKTIDFLTLCDLTTLSARTAGRYLNSPPNYVAALQS